MKGAVRPMASAALNCHSRAPNSFGYRSRHTLCVTLYDLTHGDDNGDVVWHITGFGIHKL
jgi:hypothetical protein